MYKLRNKLHQGAKILISQRYNIFAPKQTPLMMVHIHILFILKTHTVMPKLINKKAELLNLLTLGWCVCDHVIMQVTNSTTISPSQYLSSGHPPLSL